ncbi:SgcJ/EcaC family oxidoreductase [Paenibacillus sp. GSMTC-2017]|uniref:SgcJ/EcaC family oxidoreductase n=1 Tax=Paenibacillus sp. GSMTC-2017 TaxID=2794350 RepID=UPI0018D81560|nr:SgcJ/EcaC family oxidoreductase [Paenibacillus sp. GSMTC-2017]MBH5318444.1 SgcJ/EcaC family oxidoreductase [Paenibacillus sp. GSMTC-2017]
MSNKSNNDHSIEEQERDRIRGVITEMESAFNRHDAEALDLHFTQNATWVNVFGERLTGWNQINEAHKFVLEGPLKDSYASYKIESIVFAHSDVAIAHIRQFPTTAEGEKIDGGQGSIAIYVLVKEEEVWRLIAGQNTFVKTV